MIWPRFRTPVTALALLVAAQAAPGTARAQAGAGAAPSPAVQDRSGDRCATGPITRLFIDNHSVFDTTDPELDKRFAWAYETANALHFRTRRSVIRRELLFREGDCFDPRLLEESERLLRAHEFLAQVDIFGVPQADGGYHVVVDTQDEWSTQLDVRLALRDGFSFDGLRIREVNALGTGQVVEAFWLEREVTRDYGVAFESPQFLKTRWDMRLALGRTRAGSTVRQALAYPFRGETGRWAALQDFVREDRFFEYIDEPPDDGFSRVLLPVRHNAFDLGIVRRFGEPGNLTLFGTALSYRNLGFNAGGIEIVDEGAAAPPSPEAARDALRPQMNERNSLRLMLLLGKRNIFWVKRRGLDALRGEQDVRLGAEVEIAAGRGLTNLLDDDDIFGTLSFYAGFEAAGALVASRLRAEVRRDLEAPTSGQEWQDLNGEAEVLAYFRPELLPRHTLVLRARGAGAWHTSTPFQLTLGGPTALRGYADERFPGAQRVIFTAEDRIYFGWPFRDVLDLGGTLFAEVGRIWPGDVPFGVDSGWRTTIGAGLRGSFPAGGRTTYRLDLAFPVESGASWRDVRILLSAGEVLGLIRSFDDEQVHRSRRSGFSGAVFHFPD